MRYPLSHTVPLFTAITTTRRAAWALGCVAMIALIAGADFATGYEVTLSILYLLPVFAATWIFGFRGGAAAATGSAAVWYLMFVGQHPFEHHGYHGWDALLRAGTWTLFALIIDRLKLALARSDERFVTVLEGLRAAVYVEDGASGELLYMNDYGRRAFGLAGAGSPAEFEARLVPGNDPQQVGPGTRQYKARDPAGNRWYLVDVQPMRWIDGRAAALHVATDITERRHMEELAQDRQAKLEMSSRLVSAGEMATTLAHELNQPLAAILNYNTGCLELLEAGNAAPGELKVALEHASEQAQRAGDILQRARDFIRRREPRFEACDLNDVVGESVRLLHAQASRASVRVRFDPVEGSAPVHADRLMLLQLVLNLARNAMEAMLDVPAPRRELVMRTLREGDQIELRVIDRGAGLPDEMKAALFIPFFSTKPEGMGLGLHICRSVAEHHDARLWADDNAGGGSVFHFVLPARAW